MTPMRNPNAKKDRVCGKAVRISLGQMAPVKGRIFHGDPRRITGQNHARVLLEESLRKSMPTRGKTKGFSPKLISMKSIFTESGGDYHEIFKEI